MNQRRDLIGFTHLHPENPYKVYLLNNNGDLLRTISKKIRGFNPEKERENMLSRAFQTRPSAHATNIYRVHFTKENYLLVQRRHDTFKDGASVATEFISDIFSPTGDLVQEDLKTERILSIDTENNAYMVREEENGMVRILVYSLKFGSY